MTSPDEDIARTALTAAGLPSDASFEPLTHGQSGDLVARCGGHVVKYAPAGDTVALLRRESEVMGWLSGRAPTARTIWSGPLDAGWALVSDALEGTPVSHVTPEHAEAALVATIGVLARLHALNPASCPFDLTLDAKFPLAEVRVQAGLVDELDFDPERSGWTAQEVLAHAEQTRPANEDVVVAHGDASLPNFVWSPDDGVRMIDLGRFGLADRYQDLAIFLRSAKRNHPQVDARRLIREHYPLEEIDEERCTFYRLMDELF